MTLRRGGTTLVLAHSMRSGGRFFSIDRDAGNAWHATEVLKTAGVTAAPRPALVEPLLC